MDRIYVKHQNKAPVSQLGLDLWRDHVVRQRGIRDRMLTMLLELIQKERTGDIIDRALLRSITMVRPIMQNLPALQGTLHRALPCPITAVSHTPCYRELTRKTKVTSPAALQ